MASYISSSSASTHSASTEKRLRLLLTGLDYFVEQLSDIFPFERWAVLTAKSNRAMRSVYRVTLLTTQLVRADVCYHIGGSAELGRFLRLAQAFGVPVVMHWVGTDVLLARRYLLEHPGQMRGLRRMVHWADAPWLVDELKQVGINAEWLPLPLRTVKRFLSQDAPELPKDFRVLTYLSDQRMEFYGWTYIERLAQEYPEVQIEVMGASGRSVPYAPCNVRFLGWIEDTFDVFSRSTVFVRMTEHDGMAASVEEALSLGRYVVWTYPLPGVFQAKDYSALQKHIARLYELHRGGELGLNLAGREYMVSDMNPVRWEDRVARGLREAAGVQREKP